MSSFTNTSIPKARMTEEPLPKKVRLSEGDLKTLTREELCERWKQEDAYVQILETKYSELNSNDVMGLRESEEKLKQQQQEAARRENILVMRLATKEQEMQECTTQIQYLKQAQQPNVAQLRSTMVDPAVYLFFLKMKSELEENKDKLEQAQNELSAWKFTPDSQTGKKLMAKCRMLIQENQELGRQISQGRIAQLEAELALQKKYSEELKSSQDELNDFIIQLDEEVEGMQSTILVLQQQLRETRQQLTLRESSVPGSAPLDQHPESEAGKDCVAGLVKANGPGNTGPFDRTETAPGPSPFTEAETGINTEQDQESLPSPSPSTTGTDSKLCSHFRTITNQLSEGYETVDSPTGSDTSVTQHFIETNSNQDPQEDRIVARTSSSKGGRTVGSCSTQNGLNVTG